jgi:hypothetical protein
MCKLSSRVFRDSRQTAIIFDEHVPPKLVAFTESSLLLKFEYKGMISCLSSIDLARETITTREISYMQARARQRLTTSLLQCMFTLDQCVSGCSALMTRSVMR